MDHSECLEFVRAHASPLLKFMGCGQWYVIWETQRIDDPDTVALCWPNSSYDQATIEIDPEKNSGTEQLLDTMFHEVCHLILAPVQDALDSLVDSLPKDARKLARSVRRDSVERSILGLERSWRASIRALYLESRRAGPEPDPGPVGPRPRRPCRPKAKPCRTRP